MSSITFEQLPEAVSLLIEKLDKIERLLLSQSPPSSIENDQFLTIKQAAEMISLTVPTIYALVHRSEIPVCKKGKRLYFSKQDLMKWINEGRKKTSIEIGNDAENYLKKRHKG
ncbi:MAG TPA: helix-turn-helix domain-containing protein [Bacteroidia bacterium]|nr:helix-turn-helix domain-containing protein [Bacteroidia bacterium]